MIDNPVPAIIAWDRIFLFPEYSHPIFYYFKHMRRKEKVMKKRSLVNVILATVLVAAMGLVGCGAQAAAPAVATEEATVEEATEEVAAAAAADASDAKSFKIGICNYVDDASLNQIVENIQNELKTIGETENVQFEVMYDNCNADANVLAQIVSNFMADNVDLMIGVATPVAIQMQSSTDGSDLPVVFSAVSDPVGAGLVASMDQPGSNITGTSDALNTDAIMNIILANNPDTKTVGLLYDAGQDSSTKAIADAKAFLEGKGVKVLEYTATSVDETKLAVDSLIADGVDAVFTPTDNTIMTAELSIYEALAEAKIPHFCGADSFALNGAFLGFGVDYAALGVKTADMAADILLNNKNVAEVPVQTFDNGAATINIETCEAMGYNFDDVQNKIAAFCTTVSQIETAENFE